MLVNRATALTLSNVHSSSVIMIRTHIPASSTAPDLNKSALPPAGASFESLPIKIGFHVSFQGASQPEGIPTNSSLDPVFARAYYDQRGTASSV